MENMEYSVIIRTIALDPIKYVVKGWLKQTILPKHIIFAANGYSPIFEDTIVVHGDCIARQTNEGVIACPTDKFFLWNGDIIPEEKFAEKMLAVWEPNHLQFPFMVDIPNGDFIPRFKLPYPYAVIKDIEFGPGQQHDMSLHSKKEWLWYNEALDGYNYEDSEYLMRWYAKGGKVNAVNAVFFHIFHDYPAYNLPKKEYNGNIFYKLWGGLYQKGIAPTLTQENRYYNP